MKLIHLLAGSLVYSALFSSLTTVAFPESDSVKVLYEQYSEKADILTDGFIKKIAKEIPSLKFTKAGDNPDNYDDSFIKECEPRGYGELPFAIEKLKNGNFKVLKFKDLEPESRMVFECINSSKGVCYRLNGSGEYGNGPKDDYKEIRALVDFLIQRHFSKLYFDELDKVERDFFFYILAERLEDCIDVYGDY